MLEDPPQREATETGQFVDGENVRKFGTAAHYHQADISASAVEAAKDAPYRLILEHEGRGKTQAPTPIAECCRGMAVASSEP